MPKRIPDERAAGTVIGEIFSCLSMKVIQR